LVEFNRGVADGVVEVGGNVEFPITIRDGGAVEPGFAGRRAWQAGAISKDTMFELFRRPGDFAGWMDERE
jgi:hypothetical protein